MRLRDSSFETFARTNDGTDERPEGVSAFRFDGAGDGPVPSTSGHFARDLQNLLASLAKGESHQRTPQRMVIAGANLGAAASTVACGLAATCAASGFRVLLVDANLGQPVVHKSFRLSNEAGLSNLLSSSDSPHRLPQKTEMPNLAVITAGPALQNYSSLLMRENMFHRLEPISSHFDYIIVDCGTLPASLLGRVCMGADNVVVAVKEHVSSMHELTNIVRMLRTEAVPEPAVVMIE